jgi:hypothetical protein
MVGTAQQRLCPPDGRRAHPGYSAEVIANART